MYLSQSSHPPDGPGAWTVGKFNPRLDQWRCDPCPEGGDCRSAKRWVDVYAKFGYAGLDTRDFDNRMTAFWPCFKAMACLGGKNEPMVNKYAQVTYESKRPPWPDTDVMYLPPPAERAKTFKGCTVLDPMVENLELCKLHRRRDGNGPQTT